MKLNTDYAVIKREDEQFLVNTENGDAFLINDVVISIVETCGCYGSVEELANAVFSLYQEEDEDYSREDLIGFIRELKQSGILID